MAIYYVRKLFGSPENDGLSFQSAFKSLGVAIKKAAAGDTIHVYAGEYDPIVLKTNGIKLIGHRAIIDGDRDPSADHGIVVTGNRVLIRGMEIRDVSGTGIAVSNNHHTTIRDNHIHDNDGHGISAIRTDYLTIDGNEVDHNIGRMYQKVRATSGISIFNPKEFNGADVDYRIQVTNNNIHDNGTEGKSDGYGLIFDKFSSFSKTPYDHPSLISNNFFWNNGDSGTYLYFVKNVTVSGNSYWHNAQDETKKWGTEFGQFAVKNIVYQDNVAEADKDEFVFFTSGRITNTSKFIDNRLYVEGHPGDLDSIVSPSSTHGLGHSLPTATDNWLGADPGDSLPWWGHDTMPLWDQM